MTLPPDDERETESAAADSPGDAIESGNLDVAEHVHDASAAPEAATRGALVVDAAAEPARPLFANVFLPDTRPPERIPNLGHVGLLTVYIGFGIIVSLIILGVAVRFHLFHISTVQAAVTDVHYALGSEVILYLIAFGAAYFTFPLIWHEGFFTGLEWRGATALRLRWRLIGVGLLCYLMAMLNIIFIPGPANAPIENIFKQPGAAWLLFFFGITFAPFFEELFFRGFLLPALCTACDWVAEKAFHLPRRPLRPDGHPQWSLTAMAIASVITSVPFALMHAEQTGNSVDAVLLLGFVSLALCAVRLITRSLASSVLVHAFYNFLLFSMMVVLTEGFRHLDKM